MPTEEIKQHAESSSAPALAASRAGWGRPLAVVAGVVFVISSAFPVVAGFVKDPEAWPKWWGWLDVGLAFVLAALAFTLIGFTQGKLDRQADDAAYRLYRVLTHGILVMCVVYFIAGNQIIWTQCLTGISWRMWLFLYCLPAWFAAFGTTGSDPTLGRPN